jgi:hypothetical protein
MTPVLPPVHPMTAFALPTGTITESVVAGYAPAPGAGLGSANLPGSPYAEGELRAQVAQPVTIFGSAGVTFHDYFLPWPSSVSAGVELHLFENDQLALAVAPRAVAAATLALAGSESAFGTRVLGGELPVLVSHSFGHGLSLTGSVWMRAFSVREEDTPTCTRSTQASCPSFTGGGRTFTLGGALQFSFPRTRGGTDSAYHVFLGAEELWLKQTSDADLQAPYLSLRRLSLTFGLGVALWQ